MALSAGDRLGPYEILAPLGAGGMGEVYRATDTKLGREVAIKILPPEVIGDSERLARFQREAHLLASLNHPHIAAIYGLEEADGKPFLVLELVEGEDLQQRLERGAIPVDETLEIARQIAEAVEEAHEKGIVHRDLKPANLKLTPDGKVKVLDFGLAKAYEGDGGDGGSGRSPADLSQSPTLAHSGTAAGVILGTAAYMSPEQARGKPIDKRADIWAFGVVLFEMLTGRQLFAGDTVSDTLASILIVEPDWTMLPADTPRRLRDLLHRCLRKDPRNRLHDIADARIEIEEARSEPTGGLPDPATSLAERPWWQRALPWGLAIIATGLAATLAFIHLTEVPATRPASHFVVDAPEGWSFMDFGWPVPSPDGRHIVIRAEPDSMAGDGTSTMLWLRSLASPTARLLAGTEGASFPFWSPDGRFVGFFAGGEVRKLNIADGVVQRICALPGRQGLGGDWNQAGTIIFAVRGPDTPGLYTVTATGGEARPHLKADVARGERFFVSPRFLPDGRGFVFVVFGEGDDVPGTYVGSLDSTEEKRLLVPGVQHLQQAGGHVLFNREATLLAQPFDTNRAEASGEPTAIASSVAFATTDNVGYFGVSPGGVLAYLSGEGERRVQLTWLDRQGERIGTVGAPGVYWQIALSPDERRVAVEIEGDERMDLWVIDVARGVASRLTSDPANEMDPVWSPDGQEIVFGSFAAGRGLGLFRKGLSGEPAQPIPIGDEANAEFRPIPHSWSSDGKTVLYKRIGQNQGWAFPLEGGGEAEVVLNLEVPLNKLRVSPDGRWLAYISEESGKMDVYVEPFRRSGERVRVSRDGGASPRWRGDAKELFYQTPDGMLMAVEVREGTSGPEVSLPTALFDAGPFHQGSDYYGVSADGQRFLVRVPVETERKLQVHIVLNWESLLDQSGE